MEEIYPMRINKYLALKNYSTRRGADELIEKHLVLINGRHAMLGDKVNSDDIVEVKAKKNQTTKGKALEYYAYNKPIGVVTLAPNKEEKSIADSVDLSGLFPIGRLDKDSHGLIILTNDGRITDRLLNPKHPHEKEYEVVTALKLRSNFKDKLEGGIEIEDGGGKIKTKPCKIEILTDKKFRIILSEGKKHQIRRMCSAHFAEVRDLKRIRIMNIKLGNLKPNQYRKITGEELKKFLKSLGL